MSTATTTRQQARAQAAVEHITAVKNRDWAGGYGRLCLKLPALIQQCGLCQTIAYVEAKGKLGTPECKPEYRAALTDLTAMAGIANPNDVREADVSQYQLMSRNALACAEWLSRYAEALLDVKRTDEGRDE